MTNIFKKIVFHNYFPLISTSIIFGLFLYKDYYSNGTIVLGSEGSYYTDFILFFKNQGYTWYNSGTGMFSFIFDCPFYLTILQTIFNNERFINFVVIYSLYFLPFMAVYLLSLTLKLKPLQALLISIFYVTNPFNAILLQSINQWNLLVLYILPANFLIIYKYYFFKKKFFLFFGLHSLIFAFTNANPPTMAIIQISTFISILVTGLIKEKLFSIKIFIQKYLLIIWSFILFNIWWIANLIYIYPDATSGYTKDFAIHWLSGSGDFIPSFWRIINLTSLMQYPVNVEFNYFAPHYSHWYATIILLIPIFIFFYLLTRQPNKIYIKVLMIFFLITILFANGTHPPFGNIYQYLVFHLPLFSIFKSAAEKWGVLVIYFLTMLIILSLKNKISKLVTLLLIIYVGYCSIPIISGNLLPEAKINSDLIHTKKFFDKPEYRWLKQKLNQDSKIYRILSLQGSLNYQIALRIDGKKHYTGNDPILSNTTKPFLTPYNGTFTKTFDPLFTEISKPNYQKLLPFFNIKKIVINKDITPWFGFKEKESLAEIENIFQNELKFDQENNGAITLFDVGDNFLPRFYISKANLFTDKDIIEDLINLTNSENFDVRTAIFADDLKEKINSKTDNIPNITFVRINPTKYKIKVENANGPYVLVFSESFHQGWKLYLDKNNQQDNTFEPTIAEYFDGQINEVSHQSLLFYQNIFETITKKSIGEHLLVNGYANAWQITPDDTNNQSNYNLIVEYYPQRLFYFGVIISLITFLLSLILLIKIGINASKTK